MKQEIFVVRRWIFSLFVAYGKMVDVESVAVDLFETVEGWRLRWSLRNSCFYNQVHTTLVVEARVFMFFLTPLAISSMKKGWVQSESLVINRLENNISYCKTN